MILKKTYLATKVISNFNLKNKIEKILRQITTYHIWLTLLNKN